ncbi:MAG: hypothetical protein K8S55_16175 [Phycisphaerae bacterium]|nr:hypothetical protein [Phycisphaerae bacterium]
MAASSKSIRVDLFMLEFEHNPAKQTIVEIFQAIIQCPIENRVYRAGGLADYPFCMYEIHENQDHIWGMIGRIRSDLLDPKGNLQGELKPLDWAADEGQVQLNHFVFDKNKVALAFPYQQAGIRISRFLGYLSHFITQDTILSSRPVLRKETFSKLLSQTKLTTELELRYKIPANKETLSQAGLSNDKIIRFAGEHGAARLTIVLKPEKLSKAKSSLRDVKDMVESYIGHEDIVKGHLKVFYGDDNQPPDLIKLTDMAVFARKTVEVNSQTRMLSAALAYQKLKETLREQAVQIDANSDWR